MSLIEELTAILTGLGFPVETGYFSGIAPDEYAVITPLSDVFALYGDDDPIAETREARISLFKKGNYIKRKNQLIGALLMADFLITNRYYVEHEDDTQYHNYAIDVLKNYEMEDYIDGNNWS